MAVVALADGQLGDGRPSVAEFVVDGRHLNVVVHQGAVGPHAFFGHDEERDPPDPGRGPGDARQHEVDHVFHPVVVRAGDENLLPPNPIGPVGGRLGGGGQVGQAAAGLGLGEGHGPLPAAGQHGRHPGGDLLRAAEGKDQVGRPGGELRVDAGRVVGRGENEAAGIAHGQRKLEPVVLLGKTGGDPPPFPELAHHSGHRRVHPHLAVHQFRPLAVHLAEAGGQQVPGQPIGRIQGQIDALAVVLGEVVVGAEGGDLQHLVEQEAQVAFGEGAGTHERLLWLEKSLFQGSICLMRVRIIHWKNRITGSSTLRYSRTMRMRKP